MQLPTDGKLLVVDDEEGMRSLIEALLESIDIPFDAVASGEAAVRAVNESPDAYLGCLLDMNLDDSTGEAVYDQIKAIAPSIRVFPMSGICSDEIKDRLGNREIAGLIVKPFAAYEFVGIIQKGLA